MVIKIGVIVNKGFEKAAVVQIRELLEGVKNIAVEDSIVIFESKTWDDAHTFVYQNQIANRVIYLLNGVETGFDYSDDEDLIENVKKFVTDTKDPFLKELITKGVDFRVSVKIDEHTDVTYLESEIGGVFIEYAGSLGKELKVNLKNPSMNVYIYIYNAKAYVGIDLSDDLSKREYKIFNNAVSLKGPTAFGLLMLAGYTPKDIYLNPCCYSGTIEIEAALYATKTSHRFYDKSFPFMKLSDVALGTDANNWDKFFKKLDSERNDKKYPITGSDKLLSSVAAATKNAKIAGMESVINFRRIDLDWMDIKFEDDSVDKIISFIPGSSKHDKHLVKDFKQLFYQAEYVLTESGKLVIMCLSKDLLIQSAEEYFDLDHESTAHSGSQIMHILFFKRKKGAKAKDKKVKQETKD